MALMAISDPLTHTNHLAVRLQSIEHAATGVALFTFESLGGPLPAVRPGAHVDVFIPEHHVRQYSLITPRCSESRYVIAVQREARGRGGSLWMHDQARVGMTLELGHPRNNFELDEAAPDTLLLAGGIGITPLFSMFEHLRARGRPVRLYYWMRSRDHAVFHNETAAHPEATLSFSTDATRPTLEDALSTATADTAIYCCGPSRMLDACFAAVPSHERLHVERFEAPAAAEPLDESAGFTVRLARQGRDIDIPQGATILDTLIEAGIDVEYSCEEGICGACETRVIDGQPLHRDSVRTAEGHDERQTIMICCSGSRTPGLTLDI
jgi:tetrachlorobenzoquinone reductase